MLKGVNRQVIEIAQPESAYFEKVIFFVKPEYSDMNISLIKNKTDKLIKEAGEPPKQKSKNRRNTLLQKIIFGILAACAGGITTGILSAIF